MRLWDIESSDIFCVLFVFVYYSLLSLMEATGSVNRSLGTIYPVYLSSVVILTLEYEFPKWTINRQVTEYISVLIQIFLASVCMSLVEIIINWQF